MWWLNQTEATAEHLAYVNDAGRAVIRVDNTTNVPASQDPRRNTVRPRVLLLSRPTSDPGGEQVRITSKDSYDYGSLWVFDATHLPYGCSVWPAFWTKGPTWPDDGEIGALLTSDPVMLSAMLNHARRMLHVILQISWRASTS